MNKTNFKPQSFIIIINKFFFIIVLALFVWGTFHVSDQQDIFHRYSYQYAILLVSLAFFLLIQLWIHFFANERILFIAGNFYTFVVSSIIVIFLVEISLRFFNPWGIRFFHELPYHMQGMVDHPQLGYEHPRGVSYELGEKQVILNRNGLRDREIPYTNPVGESRILSLGDSVTFGWGVDQGQTFSDHMESLLKKRTDRQWEVINAGVNGYNTEQEQIWLELEGLKYSPKIVVLTYVGNDIDAIFDPNLTTWRRYPTWPSSLPMALDRLKSLSFLFQVTNMFTRMHSIAESRNKSTQTAPCITNKTGWKSSKTALERIANTLREQGIHFLVAKSSGSDACFFEELEAANINAITLKDAWSMVPASSRHVSRIDSHPSAMVHERMAVLIVDELERLGWILKNDQRRDMIKQ